MLSRVRAGLLVTCALLLNMQAGSAAANHDPATLPYAVQQVLLKHKIPADSLSVLVQEVSTDQPLLAVHADVARNPASAIKLLTTLAALHELGPAYTWRTSAVSTAALKQGRLQGDLYIKGGGDPFLVTERFWKFLLELRQAGVQHIDGDLVIDNSLFDLPPGDPALFDGRPYRPYNVLPQATLLNFGATRFSLIPQPAVDRVDIVIDPPTTTLTIDNQIQLTNGSCSGGPRKLRFHVLDASGGGHVRFSGQFPNSCGRYALTRAVANGPLRTFGSFKSIWSSLGGSITGGARTGVAPANARVLHSYRSPTLAEIIRTVNKFSNNVMSRQLLLTLGAERVDTPATIDKGRAAIDDWLKRSGLQFPELFMDNGSGLSRQSRISARSLGDLLRYAYHSPLMPEFVSSLPLSAVDGTLRKRFKDHDMAGRLHVKTGTIDDVRTMGGFLHAADGRTFVVVTLHNHRGIQYGTGTLVQDALLKWLYEQ